jgi:hypothetical protein
MNRQQIRGLGSWSPDLPVSPLLSSLASSVGVAMGGGGWVTERRLLAVEEEETERLRVLRGGGKIDLF